MLIKPAPIFADDIVATGNSDWPVSVDCAARGRLARPLAHGWLRGETAQPGLTVYAADYEAYEDYAVHCANSPGVYLEVNLGSPQSGDAGRLPWEIETNGVYALNLREPLKRRNLRGAGTQQMRSGVTIDQEWLATGRLDDIEASNSHVKLLLHSHMKPWKARASTPILSAARRLTASMNAVGPLGRLRRETVGLELSRSLERCLDGAHAGFVRLASRAKLAATAQISTPRPAYTLDDDERDD